MDNENKVTGELRNRQIIPKATGHMQISGPGLFLVFT